MPLTPGPVASTTPATSRPSISGSRSSPIMKRSSPFLTLLSIGFTLVETTRTSTSPSPGCGVSTVATSKASGPPNLRKRTAFIPITSVVGRAWPGTCVAATRSAPVQWCTRV